MKIIAVFEGWYTTPHVEEKLLLTITCKPHLVHMKWGCWKLQELMPTCCFVAYLLPYNVM